MSAKRKEKATPPAVFTAEAATADLLRAVSKVAAVVEPRNTIPILNFVEIAVDFSTIAVSGTDLDMEVRVEIEGSGEGALCLPAFRLRDFLQAASHVERVSLTINETGVVEVTAGDFSATMFPLPAADFPRLQIGSKAWDANLAEGVVQFLFGGVTHAISREETRYYLNGVCLEVKDGTLIAVATDGHRLAKRETNLGSGATDQPSVIVPRKAVALSLGYAGKGEASFAIHKTADDKRTGYAEITANGVRVRTKLIDGTYPDWRHVVPVPSNTVIEIDTKALRRALRATATSSEGRRVRATKIEVAADSATLSSQCPGLGEARVRVACEAGGPIPIVGINGRYLDNAAAELERVGSKTVRIHVTDPASPIRIVPDAAIPGVLNVIMPMRI
ncbi:DNA polymerase III subunit beta [Enterovirga aerilata]|uniref:Beta sliding clamp n=1 Tax=Enterovirga aerilata TaxID=2730920 RepID=A0A849IFU5_9HYPH|nr:DNA polymerase III subunit beta [Enterovirga sp. DB1703]NNM75030.1 DNA polymerase III subunit beta [Enterovirga sp. DB1703]